jgi:hypothetical protein
VSDTTTQRAALSRLPPARRPATVRPRLTPRPAPPRPPGSISAATACGISLDSKATAVPVASAARAPAAATAAALCAAALLL